MTSSELKAKARESLKGKWGKAALITLVYVIINWVINFILGFIPFIGGILVTIISLPISFGLLVTFMKLKRNEEVTYTDFLSLGFSNFGKVWGVFGNMILKLIIPIVLVVVFIMVMVFSGIGAGVGVAFRSTSATTGFSGLIIVGLIVYIVSLIYLMLKSYYYTLSFYILYDNPNKTGKEIVEESQKLMTGNRWSFFWLGFTFIGWAILASFTFGIGMFWLIPYMMVTFVAFYESLAGNKNDVEVSPVQENE